MDVLVTGTSCLCEGQSSLVVHFEDLLDGIDVGSRPQVQSQVVLGGRAHDLLRNNESINSSINWQKTHLECVKRNLKKK